MTRSRSARAFTGVASMIEVSVARFGIHRWFPAICGSVLVVAGCGSASSGAPGSSTSQAGGGQSTSGGYQSTAGGDQNTSGAGSNAASSGGATSGAGGVSSGSSSVSGGSRDAGASSASASDAGAHDAGSSGHDAGGSGGSDAGLADASFGGDGGDVIATFSGALATGISWTDNQGNPVNAHGGCINREGNTFYMYGEYFVYVASDTYDENNSFKAFAMYSSQDLTHWTWVGQILPQQPSGMLGPNRVGERPHILKCPSTGEYVLYAHAASIDYQTDKETIYATSPTIDGTYTFQGALEDSAGDEIVHSDMSAYIDANNVPYVITESGNVYELASDCHSWTKHTSYAAMANMEAPTVFHANDTYFWLMSSKTGWRANDDEYAAASAMTGPWTNEGDVAPAGQYTWLSQSTCVLPVTGNAGTVYLYWGDHWDNTQDMTGATSGKDNAVATYVFQPLVVSGSTIGLPMYYPTWQLDITAGTWTAP